MDTASESAAVLCRDIVPLNAVRDSFNFSLEQKRVLNFEHVVSEADNIKQDMSIDVYGREPKEDDEPKSQAAQNQQVSGMCS